MTSSCFTSLALPNDEKNPNAIIADFSTEYFRVPKTRELRAFHEGIVCAIGVKTATEPADQGELDLYYNHTKLNRKSRGLAFWKPEPLPEVIETPVQIHMPYAVNEYYGFLGKSTEPTKEVLVIVSMQKIEPGSEGRSSESPNK